LPARAIAHLLLRSECAGHGAHNNGDRILTAARLQLTQALTFIGHYIGQQQSVHSPFAFRQVALEAIPPDSSPPIQSAFSSMRSQIIEADAAFQKRGPCFAAMRSSMGGVECACTSPGQSLCRVTPIAAGWKRSCANHKLPDLPPQRRWIRIASVYEGGVAFFLDHNLLGSAHVRLIGSGLIPEKRVYLTADLHKLNCRVSGIFPPVRCGRSRTCSRWQI